MENNFFEKVKKSDVIPGDVYCFASTESTNAEAKMAENPADKSVFIAETQNAGRGRMGRTWSSPAGAGIWMSICLLPKNCAEISLLTLLAGVAVSRAIPETVIKWPNDVLLNGKKLCGVLTEAVTIGGKIKRVIVGIGININTEQFPPELDGIATSVFRETKIRQSRIAILEKVLEEFFAMYDEFVENGFSSFYDEYVKKCITVGKEVTIIRDNKKSIAFAKGIAENGELIIETDGKIINVNSGEVSVRGVL